MKGGEAKTDYKVGSWSSQNDGVATSRHGDTINCATMDFWVFCFVLNGQFGKMLTHSVIPMLSPLYRQACSFVFSYLQFPPPLLPRPI